MKFLLKVKMNPHKTGELPVYYNGIQVGVATLSNEGDDVTITINKEVEEKDRPVIDALIQKLKSKTASVSSFGTAVDQNIIEHQTFLDATTNGYVINDLPDYIPSTDPA